MEGQGWLPGAEMDNWAMPLGAIQSAQAPNGIHAAQHALCSLAGEESCELHFTSLKLKNHFVSSFVTDRTVVRRTAPQFSWLQVMLSGQTKHR